MSLIRAFSRRGEWWFVVAMAPMLMVLYSALLAAPTPAWLRVGGIAAQVLQGASIPLVLLAVIPAVAFPVVLLHALVAWLLNRPWSHVFDRWRLGPAGLASAAALAWASPLIAKPLWSLRYSGARACAERGDLIVSALERYQKERGHYPGSLNETVPTYLESIPAPGALAYSKWDYRLSPGARGGNFELMLLMSHTAYGDRLVFWPSNNYPEVLYSGAVIRLGRWAYIRE